MIFFSKHWYDIGGGLALLVLTWLGISNTLPIYNYIMWLSLVSLFLHQLEEYRWPGTFPGMVNRMMYKSEQPDRFPLNPVTAVYVNVFIGWLFYFMAALFAQHAVWLGIATMLISTGNIIAHTIVFNIKGKTFYNAGLITCWLLFAPCTVFFIITLYKHKLASPTDYLIGIPLGIVLNIVGILKMIDWFADNNSSSFFSQHQLLPADRRQVI